MVGFSRHPETAIDDALKFDLINPGPSLKSYQEGLTALYTCEYVNIDGYLQEHGWNSCSDQLKSLRHSLHYGYCYGYDSFIPAMRGADLADQHCDERAGTCHACNRAFPRDINWSDAQRAQNGRLGIPAEDYSSLGGASTPCCSSPPRQAITVRVRGYPY